MSKKPTTPKSTPFTGTAAALIQTNPKENLYYVAKLTIVDGIVVEITKETQEEFPGLIIPRAEAILWDAFHNHRDNK